MSKLKAPPLRRIRLDGRGWLGLLALAALWFLVLRGWPLIGHEAARLLGRWVHPGAATLTPTARGLFDSMAPVDVLARFGLYALETAAVGLVGWLGFSLIARERPGRLLTDAPRFRFGLLAFGLVVCAGALLGERAVLALMAGAPMRLGWGLGSGAVQILWGLGLLALTLMVGLFEEATFRGGLLRLAARSPWLAPFALLLNAALFAAVHGVQSPIEFVDRFALGIALGYATLRLRGIELAVGLHAGFDFAAMLLHPGLLERQPGLPAVALAPLHAAAPAIPLVVELVAGSVMALVFALIAIVLTEIAVRLAGAFGLGLRERRAASIPEPPIHDESWLPDALEPSPA